MAGAPMDKTGLLHLFLRAMARMGRVWLGKAR